jgi:hypothetical protein
MQKLPDNFLFGVLTALLCLGLSYFLIYGLRLLLINHYGNPFVFAEPKIQLLSVLINIILFRLMTVNLKKEKTGRGILFTTVILTFIYFFLYSRYHFRMSSATPTNELQYLDASIYQ